MLSIRESRKKKPRLHLEKITIDEPSPIEEVDNSIETARVEPCNTDSSILDIHSGQSSQSSQFYPFNISSINQTNHSDRLYAVSTDPMSETLPIPLKEKSYIEKKQSHFLASLNQNDLDTSSLLANRLNCEILLT